MLHAWTANIRCDRYCSNFLEFGVELIKAVYKNALNIQGPCCYKVKRQGATRKDKDPPLHLDFALPRTSTSSSSLPQFRSTPLPPPLPHPGRLPWRLRAETLTRIQIHHSRSGNSSGHRTPCPPPPPTPSSPASPEARRARRRRLVPTPTLR